ncbi:MAG: hypothetical protein ABFS17_11030 [Chloroflexota bacterium]
MTTNYIYNFSLIAMFSLLAVYMQMWMQNPITRLGAVIRMVTKE